MSTNNMHQEIRDAVSKMCLKFDNKYWQNCDEKDLYPTEFVNELTISGFLASLIPEKYGGAGLPLSAGAVILEEIHKSGGYAAAISPLRGYVSGRPDLGAQYAKDNGMGDDVGAAIAEAEAKIANKFSHEDFWFIAVPEYLEDMQGQMDRVLAS